MGTVDHARKRVTAILAEIDRLKQSEFPYKHPRDALELLDEMFKHKQSVLGKISASTTEDVIHNACSESLSELYYYVPILGFILRSTNIRNAFEAYYPLLRLARGILGEETKLIVSSEWDFSPFIYRAIPHLPGFVLIGLPAPESSNPLLIPLAGHELGHSVWQTKNISAKFEKAIVDTILQQLTTDRWEEYHELYQYTKSDLSSEDYLVKLTWFPAYTWALLQAEEMFCDFFGLRIFAESFLHAFAYLISPGSPGKRSVEYPNIDRRVSHLADAAKKMGIKVPPEFEKCFTAENDPSEPRSQLLVSIADHASASLLPELIELAADFAKEKGIPTRDSRNVSDISDEFRDKIVPTTTAQSLADIVNAGWQCDMDPDLWKGVPQIKADDKDRVLRDIMLKSMEVAEFHKRLEGPL